MSGYHKVDLGYREPGTPNIRSIVLQLDKVEGNNHWLNPSLMSV